MLNENGFRSSVDTDPDSPKCSNRESNSGHLEYNGAQNKSLLTPEDRQIALTKALQADPGVGKFSQAAFQMYLILLIACCCSGDSGFDGTVMGGINAMKQYQNYFGLSDAGAKTSIVFGIYTIGALCGVLPAGYFPDKLGRRFSMWFGNACIIAGACITASATSKSMFLGGRWLTGFGSSASSTSAKSYMAELAPPQTRGAYMGILNSFYFVGQIASTGMMVPTGSWDSDLSWRLPLYIQAVPAGINFVFVFLCPESPRWLYSVGRKKEARAILAKLHSSTADINSRLIQLEMDEIEEKIQVFGIDKRWWDFRPLFRTRADRARTWRGIMISAFGQLSGNGLITYFLPVLLRQAGIVSQHRQLVLNFVNSITSFIGAIIGSLIVDKIGRRKLTLIATGLMIMSLTIVTALVGGSTSSINQTKSNAGIAFIYLFIIFFSFGWTPMQALYPAEVLAYEARAKGLAFLIIVVQASSCINTFGLPVALQKITWKVYLIFLIWDVFEFIAVYIFMVETKGLTIEEINEIFEADNPRQYSELLIKNARKRQRSPA